MTQPRLVMALEKAFFPDALGGSQRSGIEILRRLKGAGWDVDVVCRSVPRKSRMLAKPSPLLPRVYSDTLDEVRFFRAGFPVGMPGTTRWVRKFWIPWFCEYLKRERPDVVLSDESAGSMFLRCALDLGIPSVYLARSVPRFGSPTIYPPHQYFVANSDYTAGVLEAALGTRVPIVRPLVNFKEYLVEEHDRRFVTVINPIEHKGGHVAVEVARRLPEVAFLFVRSRWASQVDLAWRDGDLPTNVQVEGPFDDMRAVYSRTRVLLAPSQFIETFGRVVVEAQVNGIPVVGSKVGGLGDTIGHGGVVVDRHDMDGFVQAVRSLSEDSAYQDAVGRAIENAARPEFDPDQQFSTMLDFLNGIVEGKG